jgi:hypothetical protein
MLYERQLICHRWTVQLYTPIDLQAISRLGEEALHGTVLSLHSFGTTFSFPHNMVALFVSFHYRDSASSSNKPRSSRRLDTMEFV